MDITIRRAVASDAPGLARVHVESWRDSYRGLMPDEVLDSPDFIVRREHFWTAALTDPRYGKNSVAAAILDGDIVGVAMAGPSLADCAGWKKQLYVLYTVAAVYGRGAGAELLSAVIDPEDSVALWVAHPNPRAQAFYRKHGFTFDGTSKVEDGVHELRMVRLPACSHRVLK